jgi:hypothetical protein
MSVNLFSLVPAAISKRRVAADRIICQHMGRFRRDRAGVSGCVGISLNTQPGNALTDTGASGFRGWLAWRSRCWERHHIALKPDGQADPRPSLRQLRLEPDAGSRSHIRFRQGPLRIQPGVPRAGGAGLGDL